MQTDRELTFSDGQAITATANSTDVISLDGYSLGRSDTNLRIYVQVDEAFTAGGAATLTVAVVQADNQALTTNAETLYTSGAKALATLVKDGKKFFIEIGLPKTTKKYLGLTYTVGTGPMTAGKLTAGLVDLVPPALNDRIVYWTGRGN